MVLTVVNAMVLVEKMPTSFYRALACTRVLNRLADIDKTVQKTADTLSLEREMSATLQADVESAIQLYSSTVCIGYTLSARLLVRAAGAGRARVAAAGSPALAAPLRLRTPTARTPASASE